ncbi:MAG: carboxy terminal-processing peptidase [Bacteriovoracia bacterium]
MNTIQKFSFSIFILILSLTGTNTTRAADPRPESQNRPAFNNPLIDTTARKLAFFEERESALQCSVLPQIIQGYLVNHISKRQVDSELERRSIDQFIKHLDPSKVYLLDSDVSEIKTQLSGAFKKLGRDCSPIENAHRVLVKRLEEAYQFAKKTLEGKNFKFMENTELVLDPNRRTHPTSTEQAQEELKKFIQFQMSNYLASDMKVAQAKKQLIHRYKLNMERQIKFKRDDLYSIFLDSVASSLDAHSNYLSKDALDDFEIQMRLSLEGIGAALNWEDGYTTVESLIPGGSAEKSGQLEPKDKILAVAQGNGPFESVIDMPLRDVVKLIRGKKGTTVRLQILRESSKHTTRAVVALVRDKISLQDEAAKIYFTKTKPADGTEALKLAVIELPSFYGDMTRKTRSSYEDMKKLIKQANSQKADGLVLDLSKNGGGLLSEAVRIAGLFIRKGNVVATQDAKKRPEYLRDEDETIDFKGPMVILTSRLSASASEIVAGALQDYRRAVIVGGDHTFGKGTVQAMMNLPADLGAIKVTTGMFFIPGGNSTQHRGVAADIPLPGPFSTKDIGEKSLDYSLPPESIKEFTSTEANCDCPNKWAPVSASMLTKLKALSSARVEKDAEFKKIAQELEETEKKKGLVKLSDSLKKQKEEKAKEVANHKKSKSRRHKSDEEYLKDPQVAESLQVLTDMIRLSVEPTKTAATSK